VQFEMIDLLIKLKIVKKKKKQTKNKKKKLMGARKVAKKAVI